MKRLTITALIAAAGLLGTACREAEAPAEVSAEVPEAPRPLAEPGTGGAGMEGTEAPTAIDTEAAEPTSPIEFKARRDPFQPPDEFMPPEERGVGGGGQQGEEAEGEVKEKDGGR